MNFSNLEHRMDFGRLDLVHRRQYSLFLFCFTSFTAGTKLFLERRFAVLFLIHERPRNHPFSTTDEEMNDSGPERETKMRRISEGSCDHFGPGEKKRWWTEEESERWKRGREREGGRERERESSPRRRERERGRAGERERE